MCLKNSMCYDHSDTLKGHMLFTILLVAAAARLRRHRVRSVNDDIEESIAPVAKKEKIRWGKVAYLLKQIENEKRGISKKAVKVVPKSINKTNDDDFLTTQHRANHRSQF